MRKGYATENDGKELMLPNSPDFVGSLPIQDRKPDHPDRHFRFDKKPIHGLKIRYSSKGCVNLMQNIVPEVKLHPG